VCATARSGIKCKGAVASALLIDRAVREPRTPGMHALPAGRYWPLAAATCAATSAAKSSTFFSMPSPTT
jgi:hypothetical protein